MREERTAQISISEYYAKHEIGMKLSLLSDLVDKHSDVIFKLLGLDLIDKTTKKTGRQGLTIESIFRCLLLKQQLRVSYEQLSFLLSDSMSYRTFVRLRPGQNPQKSSLNSTIRRITPETLEKIHVVLMKEWMGEGDVDHEKMRVDSTVVKTNIASPSDSQLLNDSIRVISRILAKSQTVTGVKIKFTDKRKSSKSMAFRIFNAKKKEKDVLYPDYLKMAQLVLTQAERGYLQVSSQPYQEDMKTQAWLDELSHFQALMKKVIHQTQRRVIQNESVPSEEKIVSIFEEHSDIIVKGFRDIQYGHKVNVCSVKEGFITFLSIEKGNPNDSQLFLPVLDSHEKNYGVIPKSIVCDGCYASQENTLEARERGVKQVVFSKPVGLSYHQMGVKKKTFTKLKNFRAGIEGNISELKRAFGMSKAMWKQLDGFKAYVWSSVISYNMNHMAKKLMIT